MNLPTIVSPASLDKLAAPGDAWPAPAPLGAPAPPGLDLGEAIPASLGRLRNYILNVAEALQIDPSAVAPLCIGIAAGCIGRTVETQARPGWTETASLWFAVLLPAGERKSSLVAELSRAVTTWQRDESERLRAPLAAYNERRRSVEAELASVRGQLARKKRGTPEREDLGNQVGDLAEELDRLPLLAAPCLVVSDFTPESLRDLLRQNGEKAAWIAPECDAPAVLGSRYSNGGVPNIDLLLKAHCGDAAPASRVGRDVSLERPALSLALCVQPVALETVLSDRYARDRGLLPRLLLVAPPSKLGSRDTAPPPVLPACREWWEASLRQLLELPWPGKVVTYGGNPTRCANGPRVLVLDAEARHRLEHFNATFEPRLRPGGDLASVSSFASKLPGALVRIATVLQLLDDPNAATVTAESLRAAVTWGAFLLDHHRHALGEASASVATRHARRLLDTCQRRSLRTLSQRDAQQILDADREETEAALLVLDAEGWTREALAVPDTRSPEQIARGGRPPGPRREVHPCLFE